MTDTLPQRRINRDFIHTPHWVLPALTAADIDVLDGPDSTPWERERVRQAHLDRVAYELHTGQPVPLRDLVRWKAPSALSMESGVQRCAEARCVLRLVESLSDFELMEDLALPYNHMGATITDAVLQAGLRYETTVWPRVQHVMGIPEAATTTGFLTVLRKRGGEEVVRWTHEEKLGRMYAVSELFIAEGVETEEDLRVWLCAGSSDPAWSAPCEANAARLLAVHGIGPKTVDYFKILCGEQDTAAIDMHLTAFLERAGVRVTSYEQAREVIRAAAAELGVPAAQLDHSIWTYMSKAGRTW